MTYDLIIIGGGPAGYVAAERAGQHGLKVLLVEQGPLGGVCLNEGCIPSKTLLNAAKIYHHAEHGEAYGVQADGVPFDLARVNAAQGQGDRDPAQRRGRADEDVQGRGGRRRRPGCCRGPARSRSTATVHEGQPHPDRHRVRPRPVRRSRASTGPRVVDSTGILALEAAADEPGGDRRRGHRLRVRLLLRVASASR